LNPILALGLGTSSGWARRAVNVQIGGGRLVVNPRSFQGRGDAHLGPIDLQEQAKSRSDADE
jgi:hypothetical protein